MTSAARRGRRFRRRRCGGPPGPRGRATADSADAVAMSPGCISPASGFPARSGIVPTGDWSTALQPPGFRPKFHRHSMTAVVMTRGAVSSSARWICRARRCSTGRGIRPGRAAESGVGASCSLKSAIPKWLPLSRASWESRLMMNWVLPCPNSPRHSRSWGHGLLRLDAEDVATAPEGQCGFVGKENRGA